MCGPPLIAHRRNVQTRHFHLHQHSPAPAGPARAGEARASHWQIFGHRPKLRSDEIAYCWRNGADMEATDRTAQAYWILIWVPLLLLALFYFYPLAKVLWISVTVPSPGLGNFAQLYSSSAIHRILIITARICAITTVLALLIGYLVAYAALH